MDWSKAKSILIIAFIVTNLILGYVLVENKDTEDIFNKEFIEDVREKLLEKDIIVTAKIPVDTPSLPKLTIEYEVYDPQEVAALFFGKYDETYDETEDQNDKKFFKYREKELTIFDNNKRIFYTSNNSEEKYNGLDLNILEEIAKNFLSERSFSTEDFKLGDYDYDPNRKAHYLEYVKIYNDRFVEESYMRFEIDNTGVTRFERYWIDTKDITHSNFTTSSAPNVLLRLISNPDVIGKTITDIDLCYYFNPNDESEHVNPQNTIKGQAIPAWRIKFSNGTKMFLD